MMHPKSIAEATHKFYRRELRGKLRVWLSWIFLPLILGTIRREPELAGILVLAAGALLRFWASGCLDKEGKLSLGGPYHFSRNPLYLGSVLIAVAIPISQELWLLTLVMAGLAFLVHVPIIQEEEKVLKEKFREPFNLYMSSVPRFFSLRLFIKEIARFFRPSASKSFHWMLWNRNKGWEPLLVAGGLLAATYGIYWLRFSPHL